MKEKNQENVQGERKQIEENWLSFMLLTWLSPLQKKGRLGPLSENDFFALNERDTSKAVLPLFDDYLDQVAAYRLNPDTVKKGQV